jgi:hypothetical protein
VKTQKVAMFLFIMFYSAQVSLLMGGLSVTHAFNGSFPSLTLLIITAAYGAGVYCVQFSFISSSGGSAVMEKGYACTFLSFGTRDNDLSEGLFFPFFFFFIGGRIFVD